MSNAWYEVWKGSCHNQLLVSHGTQRSVCVCVCVCRLEGSVHCTRTDWRTACGSGRRLVLINKNYQPQKPEPEPEARARARATAAANGKINSGVSLTQTLTSTLTQTLTSTPKSRTVECARKGGDTSAESCPKPKQTEPNRTERNPNSVQTTCHEPVARCRCTLPLHIYEAHTPMPSSPLPLRFLSSLHPCEGCWHRFAAVVQSAESIVPAEGCTILRPPTTLGNS